MTKEELAALLDGCEYREEMTKALEAQAKEAGLVVIFGGSDDLMELRGAIHDEEGAGEGEEFFLDHEGVVPSFDCMDHNNERAMERYFERKRRPKRKIIAHWCKDGYSWTYETDIPHATFDVMEDGDTYCRGIVFDIRELFAHGEPNG